MKLYYTQRDRTERGNYSAKAAKGERIAKLVQNRKQTVSQLRNERVVACRVNLVIIGVAEGQSSETK